MLTISHLSVSVDDTSILHDLSLSIQKGSIHAIMGPNGSGKSSLAYAISGHPDYIIDAGKIILREKDITCSSPDVRSRAGIFLAFQQPPAIPGVHIYEFLREIYFAHHGTYLEPKEWDTLISNYCDILVLDKSFVYRSLHDGFSGGEKKKLEMLQLLVLLPDLVVLDEIDSGLDVDALKIVGKACGYAKKQNPDMSLIIITHYQRILSYIKPDHVHVLCDGKLVDSGDYSLAMELERKGYDGYRTVG